MYDLGSYSALDLLFSFGSILLPIENAKVMDTTLRTPRPVATPGTYIL